MTPNVKSLVCATASLRIVLLRPMAANTSVSRTKTESQQILEQKRSCRRKAAAKEGLHL
jgi:hypothetical protein